MNAKYDIIIIGGGPGGYVAAIRASQLGKKVAIVEKEQLGGICCNWGCIPTKALLKNANVLNTIKNASKYGIEINDYKINWSKIIQRSRNISKRLSKGIEYLMKKNKIDHYVGTATIKDTNTVEILLGQSKKSLTSLFIVIATGTKQRDIPGLEVDKKLILSSKESMVIKDIPKKIGIIGAGAIGVEFAHLFNIFGSEVTIVEALPNILPNEDIEISKELESIFSKRKIKILTDTKVKKAIKNKDSITLDVGSNNIDFDVILVAIGVSGNINNIGLNNIGIKNTNGFIEVNEYMQTNISNIYAIGDVSGPPLLAHVASAEGIQAIEHICNMDPAGMNYENIPACTYCEPEVASVGYTEKKAIEKGYEVRVGKFPFRALGKSLADGAHDGFVKIIYDKKYGELLGCHIIGHDASNLISEIGISRALETTYLEILKTIHPHPTLSEAIHEATGDAYDEAIHI